MSKYSILIQYDNRDNVFVASIPELQGCTAHGSTQEEAICEIKTVLGLWLETAIEQGVTIPAPIMYAS